MQLGLICENPITKTKIKQKKGEKKP